MVMVMMSPAASKIDISGPKGNFPFAVAYFQFGPNRGGRRAASRRLASYYFFSCLPTCAPCWSAVFFSVLAGACQLGTEWAGLRLFHHHHLLSYFLLCHKSISISSISPF